MTKEKIEQLARVYNAMLMITTKGEDTIIMAECLIALKNFVTAEAKALDEVATKEV